jgi:hypothetical protein
MFAALTFVYHMLTKIFKVEYVDKKINMDVINKSAINVISEATRRFKHFKYMEEDKVYKEQAIKLYKETRVFPPENTSLENDIMNAMYTEDDGIYIDLIDSTENFNIYFPQMVFTEEIFAAKEFVIITSPQEKNGFKELSTYISSNEFKTGIILTNSNYFALVKNKEWFILFDSHSQRDGGAQFIVTKDNNILRTYIEKIVNIKIVEDTLNEIKQATLSGKKFDNNMQNPMNHIGMLNRIQVYPLDLSPQVK